MKTVLPCPELDAFIDISPIRTITDGSAGCSAVAICDAEGKPTRSFHQSQEAHPFYELAIVKSIEVPSGGVEFHDANGLLIHGKNSFQYDEPLPKSVKPQLSRIRGSVPVN